MRVTCPKCKVTIEISPGSAAGPGKFRWATNDTEIIAASCLELAAQGAQKSLSCNTLNDHVAKLLNP